MLDPSTLPALDIPSMAIAPALLIGGAGALLKGLGGWFGGKSKQKKEEAAAKESDRSARATHAQNEQRRVAGLRTMQAAAASRGVELPIDSSLLEERGYTGADPTKVTGAGKGWGFASSLASGLGGLGADVGQASVLSAGQPTGGSVPGFSAEEIATIAQENGVSEQDVVELLLEELHDKRQPQAAPPPPTR